MTQLDLSYLSSEEVRKIEEVLRRDELVLQRERQRINCLNYILEETSSSRTNTIETPPQVLEDEYCYCGRRLKHNSSHRCDRCNKIVCRDCGLDKHDPAEKGIFSIYGITEGFLCLRCYKRKQMFIAQSGVWRKSHSKRKSFLKDKGASELVNEVLVSHVKQSDPNLSEIEKLNQVPLNSIEIEPPTFAETNKDFTDQQRNLDQQLSRLKVSSKSEKIFISSSNIHFNEESPRLISKSGISKSLGEGLDAAMSSSESDLQAKISESVFKSPPSAKHKSRNRNPSLQAGTSTSKGNGQIEENHHSGTMNGTAGGQSLITKIHAAKATYETEVSMSTVYLRLMYSNDEQLFTVNLHEGSNIFLDGKNAPCNIYAKIFLFPEMPKEKATTTRVCFNTNSPVFKTTARFHKSKEELQSRTLTITLCHRSFLRHRRFIGLWSFPLSNWDFQIIENRFPLKTYEAIMSNPLQYCKFLTISLKYALGQPGVKRKTAIQMPGELHVMVKQARNLYLDGAKNYGVPPCAFVKLQLLPDDSGDTISKTHVVKNSRNPEWNFLIRLGPLAYSELIHCCLEIKVYHQRIGKPHLYLGGVRLNTGVGSTRDMTPADWLYCSPLCAALWKSMLDKEEVWCEKEVQLLNSL